MPSGRGSRGRPPCALYEAQDVRARRRTWTSSVPCRAGVRRMSSASAAAAPPVSRLHQEAIFANPGWAGEDYEGVRRLRRRVPELRDLLYLNAIDGWKETCRTSVCWFDELWVRSSRMPELVARAESVSTMCSSATPGRSGRCPRCWEAMPLDGAGVDALHSPPIPNAAARD